MMYAAENQSHNCLYLMNPTDDRLRRVHKRCKRRKCRKCKNIHNDAKNANNAGEDDAHARLFLFSNIFKYGTLSAFVSSPFTLENL